MRGDKSSRGGGEADVEGGRGVEGRMTNGQIQDNKRGREEDKVEGTCRPRGSDGDKRRQIIAAKRFITSLTNAYSLLSNSHFEKLILLTFTEP